MLSTLPRTDLLVNVLVCPVLSPADDGAVDDEGDGRAGVVAVELLEAATLALVPVLLLDALALPPDVDDLVELGGDLVGVPESGVDHAGAVARAEGKGLQDTV